MVGPINTANYEFFTFDVNLQAQDVVLLVSFLREY
jgi:hypothetical protein